MSLRGKTQSTYCCGFMGKLSHFLGIKFYWHQQEYNHITAYITQEVFANHLVESNGLDDANPVETPYILGHTIDSIPHHSISPQEQQKNTNQMQTIVRSLLWLSGGTRPDFSTTTSMLSRHTHYTTKQHIKATKYVIKYIKGTKNRGISFSRKINASISDFLKFPVDPSKLLPLCDANWDA